MSWFVPLLGVCSPYTKESEPVRTAPPGLFPAHNRLSVSRLRFAEYQQQQVVASLKGLFVIVC